MNPASLALTAPVDRKVHRGLPNGLWLSLAIHGLVLGLVLHLAAPSTKPHLSASHPLSLVLSRPETRTAIATPPQTSPTILRQRAHIPVVPRPAEAPADAEPLPPPAPPSPAAPASPPAAEPVLGLSAGRDSGLAFASMRHRSPWQPRALSSPVPTAPPPAADINASAATSYPATLSSALTALLAHATAPNDAGPVACRLIISSRLLTCSDPQWHDWLAAQLRWEQLPPPEAFGQPAIVAVNLTPTADGQLAVTPSL